jgi:hypothetical protein
MAAVIARFLGAPPAERAGAVGGPAGADMDSVAAATLGVYDLAVATAGTAGAVPARAGTGTGGHADAP